MKSSSLFFLTILAGIVSASPGIPRLSIDTIVFDEKLPVSAQESVRSVFEDRKEMFRQCYGQLLFRCEKCRGTVTLEFSADSSGIIDSVFVVKVTSRIVDRLFLDLLADCIPVSGQLVQVERFRCMAKIRFWSNVERGSNSESGGMAARVVSLIFLAISLIISISMLGRL
jgi:hypothetical protein